MGNDGNIFIQFYSMIHGGIDDETMRFWATFSDKTGETGTKLGLEQSS